MTESGVSAMSEGVDLYMDIREIWERLGLLQAQSWEREPSAV
jgi:hypothetical protein